MESFLSQAMGEMPRQVDQGVAVLWYLSRNEPTLIMDSSDLADTIHSAGLPRPNPTRLRETMQRDIRTVKANGGFRIHAGYRRQLDERLLPFVDERALAPTGELLPRGRYLSGRRYLVSIGDEANGAFEHGLFNCAAVMARRMTESLLIDAYINIGRQDEIKVGEQFLALEGLINHACSKGGLTVSRGLRKELLAIKKLGDLAAHDRTFVVGREDLWEIRTSLRRTIEELVDMAGYNGSAA